MTAAPDGRALPLPDRRTVAWGRFVGALSLVALALLLCMQSWFAPPPPDEYVRGLDDRHAFYARYRLLLGSAALVAAGLLTARRLLAGGSPRRSALRTAVWTCLAVATTLGLLEASVVIYERRAQQQAIPDPQLGYALNPGTNDVNDLGLRNPPIAWSPRDGEIRILCLGDSCTFGVGASRGYPAHLESTLRSRHPGMDITVLNAGTPGYTSSMGLVALRRYIGMRPRYILWSYAQNDCRQKPVPDSEALQTRAGGIGALLRRSHFYGFLREEIFHHLQSPLEPVPGTDGRRVPEAEFLANLEEAAAVAAAANAQLVVVSLPDRDLDEPHPSPPAERRVYLAAKARYRAALADRARALGLPVIDVAEAFRGRDMDSLFIWDHYHPTPEGYRVIGHYVSKHLEL